MPYFGERVGRHGGGQGGRHGGRPCGRHGDQHEGGHGGGRRAYKWIFLPDPGVSGVRSMGPGVCLTPF